MFTGSHHAKDQTSEQLTNLDNKDKVDKSLRQTQELHMAPLVYATLSQQCVKKNNGFTILTFEFKSIKNFTLPQHLSHSCAGFLFSLQLDT